MKKSRVPKEPRPQTGLGVLNPDLIGINQNKALQIDAQIVTDGRPLNDSHNRKKAKYNTTHTKAAILAQYEVEEVTSLTMNWKGVMAKQSIDDLQTKHGMITQKYLTILSNRGSQAFKVFNRTTKKTNKLKIHPMT